MTHPKNTGYGLCECGCGQPTRVATRSCAKYGWVKGKPFRFIVGHRGRLRQPDNTPERFWTFVDRSAEDSCWIWKGHVDPRGYGRWRWKGAERLAHRIVWEIVNGDPGDFYVCHHCDNPGCVRPDHLFLGTHRDNMTDMMQKGRNRIGERCPWAKLTENDVRYIRSVYIPHDPHHGATALARQFQLSPSAVTAIVRRERWKHVI